MGPLPGVNAFVTLCHPMGFLDGMKQLAGATAEVLAHPGRLRREITLLTGGDCADYYTFLGDDVLENQDGSFTDDGKPLWLNMGYWLHAHTYPEACAALARRLGETAELQATDRVLDCGFGFAEQDLLWVQEFDVTHILGLNVTPLHVERAQRRVEARNLTDRIDLRLGSATAVPLPNSSVDKVLALESAFHFDTREDFFREAMRVLKPGGVLATADMLPMPGTAPRGLVHTLGLRRWGLPRVNAYDHLIYCQKLQQHGFEEVRSESIRGYVYPGINRYAEARKAGTPMQEIRVELNQEDIANCYGVELWHVNTGIDDYVLFHARKPTP